MIVKLQKTVLQIRRSISYIENTIYHFDVYENILVLYAGKF